MTTAGVVLLVALTATAIACPFAAMMHGHAASHENMAKAAARAHAGLNLNLEKRSEEKRALNPKDVVHTFVLTSRVKTPAGNAFNQGFPVGYAVDGVETPEITVIAGKTYRFTVLSACNHPFYLTTDSRGKGRAPMEVGFDIPPAKSNPLICANSSILWKPDASLIGKDIWYHCTVHDNMGWFVRVKQLSLCDKYTDGVNIKSNRDLMVTIIDAVIDKLVDSKSLVLEYFNGVVPAGSTDFTAEGNAAKTVALRDSLVNFFGAALGCTDGTVAAYTGGGMKEVHANMPISGVEYDFFNKQVTDVLKQLSVEPADVTAVLNLLNSADVRGAICNFGDGCFDSICTKYSKLLKKTNLQTMTAVVDAAFGKVTTDPLQIPFFNSSKPAGSTNFFADAAKLATLKARFAAFLGRAEVLGCTDPAFPNASLSVPQLKALHAPMPIDAAVFKAFNDDVIAALGPLGIDAADQVAIRKVLDSTEPLICNQPGCSTIPANVITAFDLSVATKPMGHYYFGQGFPAAFRIDGQFTEGLVLEAGKTYAFKASQGCLHPFYFSNGTGAGSPDFENGIAAADIGQVFCNGKVLSFTPQAADVGKNVFYVCKNHNFMGGRICIVPAGSPTNVPCTVNGAANVKPSTPCDQLVDNVKTKLAGTADAAKFKNATAILSKVVVDLFLFGAVNAPAPLKKYFDGTFPSGSRDFITNTANQGQLVTALVNFFGAKLGCSDNSIAGYPAGTPEPNMKTVHQFMQIKEAEFNAFNDKLIDLLVNFNGVANSGLSAATANTVRVFLNTTSTDICAECGNFQPPSICEKWAIASGLKQSDLISKAVVAVFTDLTAAGSPAKAFFNGITPCQSRNFVDNRLNQAGLVKTLVAFFGQPGVLGCSDPAFPVYRGSTDMEDFHKEMPITKALFDQFLNSLVAFTTSALKTAVGPSFDADIAAIAALFASPGVAKICNQPGCPIKGNYVERAVCANVATTAAPAGTTTTAAVAGTTTGAAPAGNETVSTTGGAGTTGPKDVGAASMTSLAVAVVAGCVALFSL